MEYEFDHIHMVCPNIGPVKDWYCSVLDAKVEFEGSYEGAKVYYLKLSGLNLILIERLPDGEPIAADIRTREGLDHFGLAVQNLEGVLEELQKKGVHVLLWPVQVRPGLRIAYIEAPYKVRIELSERTSELRSRS
jgi:lactoylglutathione lyase